MTLTEPEYNVWKKKVEDMDEPELIDIYNIIIEELKSRGVLV